MWLVRELRSAKALSHIEHWMGFSPVWVRMWRVRSLLRANALKHMEHWKGLSPV